MKKRDSAQPVSVVVDSIPKSDPARPIIEAILQVVPTSRWAFARLQPGGALAGLLQDPQGTSGELAALKTEFTRQRAQVKSGPRIAATLGPLDAYESGITLLFADSRANFGILTLLRTKELGPFTSSEISVLTLALDSSSERLSALRLNPPAAAARASEESTRAGQEAARDESGSFYVLDSDLQIVLTWSGDDKRRIAHTDLETRLPDRLPVVLEETVRDLIAGWHSDDPSSQTAGFARPTPFLVVRTQPMSGPRGLFVGVRLDRYRAPDSLSKPAARFNISPRELEVLALLLDGGKLDEIGLKLHITASTVQDHIKSMVDKTGTRNRSELIARVLGWENASEQQLA